MALVLKSILSGMSIATPQVVPIKGPLVLADHAHFWILRWLQWFALTVCGPCKKCPIAFSPCRRQHYPQPMQEWTVAQSLRKRCLTAHSPTLWESTHVQRKICLWQCPPPPPALPNKGVMLLRGPRPLPEFPLLWYFAPQPLAYCSLAIQVVSKQPTLVLALELTSGAWVSLASSLPSISGFGVQGDGTMVCAALSLLFPPQSSGCTFLWGFEVLPSQLISPSVRWLTRVWVPFFFYSPSEEFYSCLYSFSLPLSFFSFCSKQLCGFLALLEV